MKAFINSPFFSDCVLGWRILDFGKYVDRRGRANSGGFFQRICGSKSRYQAGQAFDYHSSTNFWWRWYVKQRKFGRAWRGRTFYDAELAALCGSSFPLIFEWPGTHLTSTLAFLVKS